MFYDMPDSNADRRGTVRMRLENVGRDSAKYTILIANIENSGSSAVSYGTITVLLQYSSSHNSQCSKKANNPNWYSLIGCSPQCPS